MIVTRQLAAVSILNSASSVVCARRGGRKNVTSTPNVSPGELDLSSQGTDRIKNP